MKIYTKTGDDGTTGLLGGSRRSKSSVRIDSYGTVDELNSMLGVIRNVCSDPVITSILVTVQNQLFIVGADLAAPLDQPADTALRVEKSMIDQAERHIDELDQDLPALKNFILPHGSTASSMLHLARAVCRRAERLTVSLSIEEPVNPAVIVYINRLSDLLFVMARAVNRKEGLEDTVWAGHKGLNISKTADKT